VRMPLLHRRGSALQRLAVAAVVFLSGVVSSSLPAGAAEPDAEALLVVEPLEPITLGAEAPAAETPTTIRCPEPGVLPSGEWYETWKQFKKDLEEKAGTSLSLCVIYTSQTIVNGPGEGKDRGVFWWNLNVNQRLWQGATLVTNTRGGSGLGPGRYQDIQLNHNWMQGEPREIYVSHLLLEQKLFDDKVTIWAGKLDVADYFGTNEVASWNFLSYSLARNPTIPMPYHAIGAVARYDVAEWLYVQAGVADAGGSWTRSGFESAFRAPHPNLSLYEAGLRPKIGGRKGNYRFTLWYDAETVSRVDGTGSERDNLGFGLSFDQQLSDKVTAFLRYGRADQDLRDVEHFWSVGARWKGPFAARPADEFVFGVSQAVMGRDFRRANTPSTSQETLFEMYYNIQITEWMALKPDVQVILNPGANDSNDVGVVAGLRLQLAF